MYDIVVYMYTICILYYLRSRNFNVRYLLFCLFIRISVPCQNSIKDVTERV